MAGLIRDLRAGSPCGSVGVYIEADDFPTVVTRTFVVYGTPSNALDDYRPNSEVGSE
jgi:hypothetical protein